MNDGGKPEIVRNDDTSRFELAGAPQDAFLQYREEPQRLTLIHTQVADRLEGEGIASSLIRTALTYGKANRLTIVPECPFVAGWLERHPERAEELDIAAP